MTNYSEKIFPLKGSVTYEQVAAAHKRILLIAMEIRDILNKHNIPYSIFFGTVIGAVRHKGFVPWDLDIDLGVFSEYERTISILKRELPCWLVVLDSSVDPNYCASWAKVVDRYSEFHATAFTNDNKFAYRGLHVDLYNIKETTYNHACLYRKEEAVSYFKRMYRAGLISMEVMNDKILEQEQQYEEQQKSRKVLEKDILEYGFLHLFEAETDTIFPLKNYEFEGEIFSGPNDYDRFLKGCYYKGDYMEYPPYDKRDMKVDEIKLYPLP